MVTSISAQSTSAQPLTANTTKKTGLDYNTFLTLLVAQMKNQDPTKPMDSTEYIAQLATFSNVEQSISTNKKIDELIRQSQLSQGIELIGKFVSTSDGLQSGIVETVRFSDEGVMAMLASGAELLINKNVTVGHEPG